MAFAKDPDEIGALWSKTSAKGEYMTGIVGDQRVVVFHTNKAPGSNGPDWRVLKARPRPEAPMAPSAPEGDFGDIPF